MNQELNELLKVMMSTIEAQDAKIKALEARMEASDGNFGDLVDVIYGAYDESEFDAFKNKHGSKFEPVIGDLKTLIGEDYDPVRESYNHVKSMSGTEGFSEDEYIDKTLADVVGKLNALKGIVPPAAAAAVEAAEQAVTEAAIATDAPPAEGIPKTEISVETETPEDTGSEEWSESALEKEKPDGRLLFD